MLIDERATVLVTGATGFVGRTLVHRLSSKGCRIRVLAREGSDAGTLANNYGAQLILGDLQSTTATAEACESATHIFHLASHGQSHSDAPGADQIRRVNVHGTKVLARAAANTSGLHRFMHFSTAAVHGNVADGPATESSPYQATSAYELTKLEAELWLQQFAEQQQMPLTILRPCAIMGAGDMRLLKLFRLGVKKFLPIPGKGEHRYQFIHVDDCVSVMLAAAEQQIAKGKVYICANPESLRLRELLQQIYKANQASRTAKSDQRLVSLPFGAVHALASGFARLGMAAQLSPQRLKFFQDNHWFDTRNLQADLDVEFQHNNSTAIESTLAWYRENRLL